MQIAGGGGDDFEPNALFYLYTFTTQVKACPSIQPHIHMLYLPKNFSFWSTGNSMYHWFNVQ